MSMRKSPRYTGFSFIELLAALVILSTLAMAALPLAEMTVRRHKEYELRRALRDIRTAIDAYKLAAAQGKIALQPEQSGYPPTLQDLVEGADDATRPGGPKLYFLRRIPRDPFFEDMKIEPEKTWGLRSYDSPADAPREGDDVYDVFSLSEEKALNGTIYKDW